VSMLSEHYKPGNNELVIQESLIAPS
jgi:hypothetical protein